MGLEAVLSFTADYEIILISSSTQGNATINDTDIVLLFSIAPLMSGIPNITLIENQLDIGDLRKDF